MHVKVTLYIVLGCVLFFSAEAAKLPETFPLCKKSDPRLNECLKDAIHKSVLELKEGNKRLHLLPLDPLDITKIMINQGNGPVSLNLDLENAKVYGLTDLEIRSVSSELDKYIIKARGDVPRIHIEADYTMDGKFLILPLRGKGRCNITFTNVDASLNLQGAELKKGSKSHMDITSYEVIVNKISRLQLNFENLFNGDKALGDNTNQLLNQNWSEFWEELKPSFQDTFGAVFKAYGNQIFHRIAYNDIFLE